MAPVKTTSDVFRINTSLAILNAVSHLSSQTKTSIIEHSRNRMTIRPRNMIMLAKTIRSRGWHYLSCLIQASILP